jgi:histidinol-phosphatase (PHP family)
MPHSHHSHSGQFCKHASGLLEDVVLEAVRQGFEVYGLTEHVPRYRDEDLYPEEVMVFAWFDDYKLTVLV